jgi:hypothetical protein
MSAKRPKLDLNQLAKSIVDQATGESERVEEKSGKSGGGRASRLSPAERSEKARKAALTRWSAKPPEVKAVPENPRRVKVSTDR